MTRILAIIATLLGGAGLLWRGVPSLRAQGSTAAAAGGGANAPADRWVTAWGTSQQTLGDARVTNATVRIVARVTIPGRALRVRLDNTFGTDPLVVGRAAVGLRVQGAALATESGQPLTFAGASSVTIPAGSSAWSDRATLAVDAQQDVAISLYIPGENVRPSQHSNAFATSYRSADGSGDLTIDEGRTAFSTTTTALWWVKAIDVETSASSRAIVAFGDSITDGTCSTLDAHDRWEDLLSVRLGLAAPPTATAPSLRGGVNNGVNSVFNSAVHSVVNEGIAGNTVTREGLVPAPDSPPGLERLERDVLGHHGVASVVVFMGTNDIRRGAGTGQVIAGLASIAKTVRAAGLRVIGVTIIPRHNVTPTPGNSGWDDKKTQTRREVNQWIRSRGAFDRVIDFDQVIRDPQHPDLMRASFNCGDGIHPSPAGYFAMGKAIDLAVVRSSTSSR